MNERSFKKIKFLRECKECNNAIRWRVNARYAVFEFPSSSNSPNSWKRFLGNNYKDDTSVALHTLHIKCHSNESSKQSCIFYHFTYTYLELYYIFCKK